ncbi:MAG: hypothetical protein KY454_03685 [Actinobacteria bacterium]|nr:hypothetical protein [Actinomycetota bacterium]MBW3649595.1 hypothetical protein [Actinomycetota bacterium]
MSPRAAWRLESLGFDEVYDYVGSKMDWIGEGLPFEGALVDRPRLGTLADPGVPTCKLDDAVSQVRPRLGQWPLSLVVTGASRVVLGLVRAENLGGDGDRPVAEVMQEGPSTYRPHVTAEEMSGKLKDSRARWVVVTTLSGQLVGVVQPEKIHEAAEAARA